MKKKTLVILLALIIVCIAIVLVAVISSKYLRKKDVSLEKDYLYDDVVEYLVSKEEPHYYLEDKYSKPNTNIEDFKVFSSIKKLGIEEVSQKTYVYAYIAIESYYIQDGELVINSGSFAPYKFTIENEQITKCEKPEDGEGNLESMKAIFPEKIVDEIKKINSNYSDLRLDLENKVDEYYGTKKENGNYINMVSSEI